jgi:acetyltransferase-like isoleucine patch superfamily enzyme
MPDFSPEPIPLSFSESTSVAARMAWLFGHYDLRVYVAHAGYIDVGRGSFGAALSVSQALKDYSGCIGTVGQFSDFSTSSELLPGGEHRNEQNINITFASIKAFQAATSNQGISNLNPTTRGPISIGNAVVVSANALIMSGVHIGDGALIAANAMVRTNVAPFSVVAGLPAKKIRDRLPAARQAALEQVRWWDFDTVYLGNNLARLQELSIDTNTSHVYRKPTPRIVLKMMNINKPDQLVQIMGVTEGEALLPITAAPPKMQAYLTQLSQPGPYHWLAKAWE